MPPREIRIRSNERVALFGRTGSGKTFAAFHILKPFSRVVVLDPKARIDDAKWRTVPFDRDAKRLLAAGEPIRARVVAPITDDQKVIEAVWEDAMLSVLNAGNCVLYVDEVYGVVDIGARASPFMNAIWTRGREAGIGAVAASQRPAWVPMFILSEADHFFCFRLTIAEDRRRMAEFMGPRAMEVIRDIHGLHYMHVLDEEPMYLPSLPIKNAVQVSTGTIKREAVADAI